MQKRAESKLSSLRKILKDFYINHDQPGNAMSVDRLPNRSLVRIFKIVFGARVFNSVKEAN